MWKNVASNALSMLIVICVALAGLVAWGQRQYRSAGPLSQPICLEVPTGSTMSRVSQTLSDRDAISSAPIFRLGATYGDRNKDLKAGNFLVPEGASMDEITDIVTQGGQSTCGTEVVYRIGVTGQTLQVRELDPASGRYEIDVEFDPVSAETPRPADYLAVRDAADTRFRVALAEGITSWQVVEALKAVDFLNGEVASVPPEGMLAPDSYEVRRGDDRGELLGRMQVIQERRLAEAWERRSSGLPLETPEQALILASVVEKETGVPAERRQVASVFVNRLREGMRLQTDPTVIYGVTEGKGVLGRGLRQSELARSTPYNTYQIDGLPPTPIANPGLASIEAALDPAETDFLYFVADGSGGHAFADTLSEHNENVARWRALEKERAGQ